MISCVGRDHSKPTRRYGVFGTWLEGARLWPGAPWRCQLDWASFQDIVETSDPEPTVSVGIEQQAMLAGRIGSAVLS